MLSLYSQSDRVSKRYKVLWAEAMAISILSLKSVNDLFAPTLICQVIIELLMSPT